MARAAFKLFEVTHKIFAISDDNSGIYAYVSVQNTPEVHCGY